MKTNLNNIKVNDIKGKLFNLNLGGADILKELTEGTTEKILINISSAGDFIRRNEILNEDDNVVKVVNFHFEELNDVEGKVTKVEIIM
ncbi:hypothetical protein V1503_23840 [Bacillus sp. SCS-151]|uniref:hypothetical protein n=1 Tax=Nanhaiella sioensis TaxID=3115293 RepID=UPI00397D8772